MHVVLARRGDHGRVSSVVGLLLLCGFTGLGMDWPQYRGPTTDGVSPEPIATIWATNKPGFVVWTNMSLSNGFSSFAVSQGRAFTLISKNSGSGSRLEYCVAVDAATGTNVWASAVGDAPWDPGSTSNGGDGTSPYNQGDGPRTTPSVQGTNVFVLSASMGLASLNFANGWTNWFRNLKALYGASEVGSGWNNAASPCLDSDLIFVNLNTATDNQTLCAFRVSDGSPAWRDQNERLTHTTPVVATILGRQQVVFATVTGLVGLDRTTGSNLWKYPYPWGSINTSMGASPVVYSNIVFCTAGYNKGSAAVRINFTGSAWFATNELWKQTYQRTIYQSIWMTPVIHQGYIYGQFGISGDYPSGDYLTAPLNCTGLTSSNLMWSVPNFGLGGTILVNNLLLSLTEDGQLVLIKPAPAAYAELARFRAFQFSSANPGKCWNSPAYSNGRIYARSTRGGICVDVSPPPQLKLLPPQFVSATQMRLEVGTTNGLPLDSNRLAKIEVRATTNLAGALANWPKLTNALVLATNGLGTLTNALQGRPAHLFYMTIEKP
jgi:outer membrane protein assembly factor BamB